MKPVVLVELLEAIKRVLAKGETDLSGLHARLANEGEVVQFKEGKTWVSIRVENLPETIRALRASSTPPAASRTKRSK